MMRIDGNMNNIAGGAKQIGAGVEKAAGKGEFSSTAKALEKYLSKVDESQEASDMSVKDLLSGKNEDITSVVAAVAKADMSFKLLVGVRNKLVEAYKQTMQMQI